MSRRRLDELASATEAEALSRGVTVARLELARRAAEEARVVDGLARGVRAGGIDPTSATAEGLEALARALRLLRHAAGAELARDLATEARPTWWTRLRRAWAAWRG